MPYTSGHWLGRKNEAMTFPWLEHKGLGLLTETLRVRTKGKWVREVDLRKGFMFSVANWTSRNSEQSVSMQSFASNSDQAL